MKKLCIIVLLSLLQSCHFLSVWEDDICLYVQNNSNDSLRIYVSLGQPWCPTIYPDTLLPKDAFIGNINLPHTNDSISGYLVSVLSHDGTAVLCTTVLDDYWHHGRKDKFFNGNLIPTDTLSFFFISPDSIRKYGYDYVASHNIIVARYDLSASDIKSLDMVVPYPPTVSMTKMMINNQ